MDPDPAVPPKKIQRNRQMVRTVRAFQATTATWIHKPYSKIGGWTTNIPLEHTPVIPK